MSLSYTDRENLWIQAGGNINAAPLAAAVSMAENTDGDPNVVSPTNDVGLWQINLDAHPQYSLSWLQNPLNNAKAAVAISNNGGNWNPWTTYKSGAYQQYLNGSSTFSSSTASCHTSNVPLPSVAGLGGGSVCLDGVIGVGSVGLGTIISLVAAIVLVVLTLRSSGVAKQAVALSGPVGKVASKLAVA